MTSPMKLSQMDYEPAFWHPDRRAKLTWILLALTWLGPYFGCTDAEKEESRSASVVKGNHQAAASSPVPDSQGVYHIRPSDSVQQILDAVAADPARKRIVIHEGTYRPAFAAQAMVKFHARHDGIVLEAEGVVTLTAENHDVAIPGEPGYPAVVNHVVYFGDGISDATKLRGVQIKGANGFATNLELDGPIEPRSNQPALKKQLFFYLDGGAIKIFGDSCPVIEGCDISDNRTQLCGGGISVEQRGRSKNPVRIINSIFRNNRCPATGSAIDLLEGSSAVIRNCLFVGNISNSGMAQVQAQYGLRYNEVHGCGALTVFPGSKADVSRCTFTQNWNGADDKGNSHYQNCIFWKNSASDGSLSGGTYELDAAESVDVENCWLNGATDDLRGTISAELNTLQAPDPLLDDRYEPRNEIYQDAGYRADYERDDSDSP